MPLKEGKLKTSTSPSTSTALCCNLAFDVGSPSAPSIVAEALATALSDETERTSQAIALLSLQEFLPQQINTLELGANGPKSTALTWSPHSSENGSAESTMTWMGVGTTANP